MVLSNLGVQIVMAVETFKLFAACSDLLRIFFVGKIWPSCIPLNTYGIAMLPIKYSILPVDKEIRLFLIDLTVAFLLVVNSSKSIQTCRKSSSEVFYHRLIKPESYCYHVDIIEVNTTGNLWSCKLCKSPIIYHSLFSFLVSKLFCWHDLCQLYRYY